MTSWTYSDAIWCLKCVLLRTKGGMVLLGGAHDKLVRERLQVGTWSVGNNPIHFAYTIVSLDIL